jgi:hypothetical protein
MDFDLGVLHCIVVNKYIVEEIQVNLLAVYRYLPTLELEHQLSSKIRDTSIHDVKG